MPAEGGEEILVLGAGIGGLAAALALAARGLPVRVIEAGPHCSVQDGGRPGLMRFGVPASGAMDRAALALANHALGNAPGAAAVEVSLGGLVAEVEEGTLSVAVAGGGFVVEAGAIRTGSWSVLTLCEGDRLVIRRGPWGAWATVAFAGVLVAEPWLGSVATHALSGLGGGAVTAGRRLVVALSRARLGLYVFGRQELFANCFELAPAFSKLLERPTQVRAFASCNDRAGVLFLFCLIRFLKRYSM